MADEIISWYGVTITDEGLNLIAQATANKDTIHFVRADLGIGKPSDPDSIGTMTSVVQAIPEVGAITNVKVNSDDSSDVIAQILIDNINWTQGRLITEIGIMARLGSQTDANAVMFGYDYTTNGYLDIPPLSGGRTVKQFTFHTKISRASNIEITYGGDEVYVTNYELNQVITTINNTMAIKEVLKRYPLPFREGWRNYYSPSYYTINQFGEVFIQLAAEKYDPITGNTLPIVDSEIIADLPENILPEIGIFGTAVYHYKMIPGLVIAQYNGNLETRVDDISTQVHVFSQINYTIGGETYE